MVSFNMIIAAVAAVAGSLPVVLGGTLVEATAAADIVEFTSVAERGLDTRHSNTKDPYGGWKCASWYPLQPVPKNPSCNQNNCYRAFLNARKGSDGYHCPSTAFDYCCQWYSLTAAERAFVTKQGSLYYFLPWTGNCGAAGPFHSDADVKAVVDKINDVCACTLDHKVSVTLPNDYAALSKLKLNDPVCVQHLH